ncbi:hypothetical protein B0H16DRAFT_1780763 [Mycena metata]|uniref:Transmembrane protein n=1 Tax=Mycena metata TaxID=1033252 RepID=A0AAD7MNW1_9AGAR|nr:hypothetical protein B0H16DRAFT_1780763 [Mycena metata]
MQPLTKQDLYYDLAPADEKLPGHGHDGVDEAHRSTGTRSHLRRILFPALIALVALSGLVALFCLLRGHIAITAPSEIIEGILHTHAKRASGSTTSPFIRHKLYLIVIFVGLFLVVMLGFLLACCCRSRSHRGANTAAMGGGFAAAA